MPIIESSCKLSLEQEEYRICSKPYVFFRLIAGVHSLRLMTATASEDTGEYKAFEDQKALIAVTAQVFHESNVNIVWKTDRLSRQYVEARMPLDAERLIQFATTALDRLGFMDVSVISLREMRALHEEFSANDDGDAYLSDGISVSADGRLVQK